MEIAIYSKYTKSKTALCEGRKSILQHDTYSIKWKKKREGKLIQQFIYNHRYIISNFTELTICNYHYRTQKSIYCESWLSFHRKSFTSIYREHR